MISPTNQIAVDQCSPTSCCAPRTLCLSFGGLKAVQNFSLELPTGALYGLIGPNGAGKTTVFNLLTGVYRPDGGDIRLAGANLVGRKPHEITAAGIARTFQNIRLFPGFERARQRAPGRPAAQPAAHCVERCCGRAGIVAQKRRSRDRCLEFTGICSTCRIERRLLATSLSYGHQRHLEIVRALATEPKLLLLDEPAAGMNSREKEDAGAVDPRHSRRGSTWRSC